MNIFMEGGMEMRVDESVLARMVRIAGEEMVEESRDEADDKGGGGV